MSDSLASALVKAQAEMPKIPRRGINPHFKNEYVTLDDLLDNVRPVLNKHGLAVVQFPSQRDGQPALTTILLHGETGETIESTMPLVLTKQDMQGVGGAITYARRYMLAAALGIAEGVDDDGNSASARASHGDADGRAEQGGAAPPSPPAAPPESSQEGGSFKAPEGGRGKMISDGQRTRMFAIFGKTGMPQTVLRNLIAEVCGDEVKDEEGNVRTKLIPKAKYDEVIKRIEALDGIPF